MKIKNHFLEAEAVNEKIIISKSGNTGDLIDPDYVVIHYTATDTAASELYMRSEGFRTRPSIADE